MALAYPADNPPHPSYRRALDAGDITCRLERGDAPWFDSVWLISAGAVIPDIDPRLRNDPHEAFCELFAATGMDSTSGASTSFYSLFDDTIHLVAGPHSDPDQHLRDWIHELMHATGHSSRLGRVLPECFGSHFHGREDLVAEIGTAIVCLGLGIAPKLRHPEGFGIWPELSRADPLLLAGIVRDARAAAAWLFACRDAQAAAYEIWAAEEARVEREERALEAAARRVRRQDERRRWADRFATVKRLGESLPDRRRGD